VEVIRIARVATGAHTRRAERGSARCILTVTLVIMVGLQAALGQQKVSDSPSPKLQNEHSQLSSATDSIAERELQQGSTLSRQGAFAEAIPHLLAARGRVANEYAASFNLALCYVGSGNAAKAIPVLEELRHNAHDDAGVNNLLAQAYVGDSQGEKAVEALQRAASLTPTNEKLYMFVADSCMGKQDYALGLRIVDLALKNLPDSALLHYERGMFLSLLDEFDNAKNDFQLAQRLAPDSDTAFDSGAQQATLAGDVSGAIRIARTGISEGHQDFMLLALLGEALLRSGAIPGTLEFEEARQALEKSIQLRPNYPSSQLALGKLCLIEGHAAEAIDHLEIARQLSPDNPAVYSQLAVAYRKQGNAIKTQEALAVLAELNKRQAEKIRTAPGDRKSSYARPQTQVAPHQQ
jgi:tetratricopeptide (TPR) repeat protein